MALPLVLGLAVGASVLYKLVKAHTETVAEKDEASHKIANLVKHSIEYNYDLSKKDKKKECKRVFDLIVAELETYKETFTEEELVELESNINEIRNKNGYSERTLVLMSELFKQTMRELP